MSRHARQTKLEALAAAVSEQERWIEEHGADLAGYLHRYGDPSMPNFEKFPVDGFYGNGGVAIFAADVGALEVLREKLATLHGQAAVDLSGW